MAARRHGVAHKEYEFSTRRSTISTKSGQAVLRHGDGVLGRPHRVARVPLRLFALGHAHKKYEFSTPSRRLDVAYGTGPTLEPFPVLSLFRLEAPLIGTWTTTRQDDAAQAYRLTTPGGRLDCAGEYGRRWAAPRRWRAGRAAAASPHASAAWAHISVSVRRRNWSRRARIGRAADPQAKPGFCRRPRPRTKRHLSALTVPSRNTTCSGRTSTSQWD